MLRGILLLIAILWAIPAWSAQPEIVPTPDFLLSAPTNVSKGLRLEADVSYVSEADFTGGLGSVKVLRSTLAADYSIFRLSYGLSHFMWKDGGASTFSTDETTPWDNLHDVTLQARLLNNKITDKWRYWVNGELSSSFEEDFPGAVGVGFDGGVAYDFWNGWMLGVSAKTIAVSALSDDLFGELELGLALAVSQRALRETLKSLGLFTGAADGTEKIGFSVALSGAEKTYRLSSNSPVRKNGYLGLVRSKAGAYLDYSPNDKWTFSVGPEYHYSRKYKLYDSSGKLHSSHRLDSAWGGYARVLLKF
ncbi:MAG: hypothetical protein OCC46_00590 [Pseudodesulfovibrio sp.]